MAKKNTNKQSEEMNDIFPEKKETQSNGNQEESSGLCPPMSKDDTEQADNQEENQEQEGNQTEDENKENSQDKDNNVSSEDENNPNPENPPKEDTEQKDTYKIKAKSETGLKSYYRKGLKFTPCMQEYEVSKDVYDSLKKDNHLTVEDIN